MEEITGQRVLLGSKGGDSVLDYGGDFLDQKTRRLMSSSMESIIMFPPESIDRGLPSDGEEEFDVLVPDWAMRD